MRSIVIFSLLVSVLHSAEPDWDKANEETLRHYRTLIRIDTSGPPNFEAPAAEYLKKILESEGIAV